MHEKCTFALYSLISRDLKSILLMSDLMKSLWGKKKKDTWLSVRISSLLFRPLSRVYVVYVSFLKVKEIFGFW